ncbi:MAG: hypothetical protein AB8I08_19945 [Sandaracinaceae bacterium]
MSLDEQVETSPAEAVSEQPRQATLSFVERPGGTDYRTTTAARPPMRVSRAADGAYRGTENKPEKRPGVFLALVTLVFAALIGGIILAVQTNLLIALGAWVVLSGIVGTLPMVLRMRARQGPYSRLQEQERLDQSVHVDVDDMGLRTDTRDDEDWAGSASREDIARVYAQP